MNEPLDCSDFKASLIYNIPNEGSDARDGKDPISMNMKCEEIADALFYYIDRMSP